MKFLCENCKAKYQIADEKVAGRTVRMKCRKCGHMIEVEASVTETSVAQTPPEQGGRPSVSTGLTGQKGAVGAAAMGLTSPPRAPLGPPRPPPATGRVSTPPPAGRASTPPPAGGGHGVAPPKPPARPAPRADAAAGAAGPGGGAGLAGAFAKAVAAPKEDPSSVSAAMSVLSSSSTTEEWYVGINGVPVGPVRLSELRRKAAAGLVNEESLVWREGFEEWVPLRTYPELCAMLKEASTGRTSLNPPAPGSAGPSNRPGAGTGRSTAPGAASTGRTSAPPRAPTPASVTGRSNVVALASRRATAEKIDGLEELIEDTIKFESSPPPAPPAPSVAHATAIAVAPVAPAPPAPATPLEPSVIISEPPPRTRDSISALSARLGVSRRAHPALWAVVALGGAFLGVAGMVLVMPKPPKPTVQIVSVMVPVPAPPPAPADSEGTTVVGPIEMAPGAVAAKPAGGGKAKDTPAAGGGPAAPLSTSLHGLGGLVSGPTAPNVGGPSGGGGGQLAAADVERVVQSHRAFVKRQCWESALAGRGPNAPSSVRVAVQINVAPSGSVSSASATGGDGYPGLASCVQSQVTKWKFPASEGSAVTVPFVFAAQ